MWTSSPKDGALARKVAQLVFGIELILSNCESSVPTNTSDFTFLNNTDFYGFNDGAQVVATMEDCANLCLNKPSCVAASWNGPGSRYHDNNCNLHCSTAGKRTMQGELAVLIRPQGPNCKSPPPPAPPPPSNPGWMPGDWQNRFDEGHMLISGPGDKGAQLGNGYAAFFVQGGTEFIAGVFNKRQTSSHRAAVPSPLTKAAITAINGNTAIPTAAALDLEMGVYTTVTPLGGSNSRGGNMHSHAADTRAAFRPYCEQRLYTHQALEHLLVAETRCNNTDGDSAWDVTVSAPGPELTLDLLMQKETPRGGLPPNATCWKGTVIVTETNTSKRQEVGICYTDLEQHAHVMHVAPGQVSSAVHLRTIYTNVDTNATATGQTVDAAAAAYVRAVAQADTLWDSHVRAMALRTQARIEVGGNAELARVVNATANALLDTVRSDVTYSTSPGGLATNSYHGHTFWDVCTWMWPAYLFFQPSIARAVLEYRVQRLPEALANAQLNGFEGAMFPWESAFTGTETDPAKGTTIEEHLQGDIAFAFRQYYFATGDVTWLTNSGFPVLEGIARFWASKAYLNANGTYSIAKIMGPDEYHGNVVDSVYCNVVAKYSLEAAYGLAKTAGVTPNATFKDIADKLVVLFDTTNNYHPEFQGYTRGTKIKQADTILLGYPLLYNMSTSVRQSDLDYYATVTDVNGPAMTWSMFSVNYGDIYNDTAAAQYFERGYKDNALGNYHDWHEVVGASGADNFITGAGGFMQSVFAGYGGLRIVGKCTLQLLRPRVLPNSTGLALRRVSFCGSVFNVDISPAQWTIALDDASPTGALPMFVTVQTDPPSCHRLDAHGISVSAGASATLGTTTCASHGGMGN
eukprot:m.522676 g.522676  ORF g.522676 m.522676 type:complete len:859 (+) comp21968_c0_seq3:119-2695(+)